MKKIIIVIFILSFFNLYGQEKKKLKPNLDLGMKYTFIDDRGGACLGVNVNYDKFNFSLRNDFSISIISDPITQYFVIQDYKVFMYFDVSYQIFTKSYPFAGFGWISNSDQIHRFNPTYGYYTLTLGWKQKINNAITIELRSDVPFVKNNGVIDQNIAFPLSISILYSID